MINTNTSGESPGIDSRRERPNYQPPRLSLLGDICSLTETGSMVAMEDGVQNNFCAPAWWPANLGGPANMIGNMC